MNTFSILKSTTLQFLELFQVETKISNENMEMLCAVLRNNEFFKIEDVPNSWKAIQKNLISVSQKIGINMLKTKILDEKKTSKATIINVMENFKSVLNIETSFGPQQIVDPKSTVQKWFCNPEIIPYLKQKFPTKYCNNEFHGI